MIVQIHFYSIVFFTSKNFRGFFWYLISPNISDIFEPSLLGASTKIVLVRDTCKKELFFILDISSNQRVKNPIPFPHGKSLDASGNQTFFTPYYNLGIKNITPYITP